jgi:hypothetical protein
MNTPAPCPRGPELVTLLGQPAPGSTPEDLREHIVACPSCAGELAQLREAFSVLEGAEAEADRMALRRIEARVHADAARSAWLPGGLLALLGAAVLAVWIWGLGHGVAGLGPGLLLLFGAAGLAGALSRPPRQQAAALGAGGLLVLAVILWGITDWGTGRPLRGLNCLLVLGGSGMVPAALLSLRARAGTWARGALLGAAVCTVGLAVQTALCELGDVGHMLVLHLLPWLCGVTILSAAAQGIRSPDRPLSR